MGIRSAGALRMQRYLGGYLNSYDPQSRTDLIVDISRRLHLKTVLTALAIPLEEVWLVSVNREVVALDDAWIQPDDQVRLYPPMGGG